ncbi:hypothetical protein SO802_023651 [Lithocarpus litseifolius]|uniref:Uncharacterized protein n=1 Tax=Lithocarpus litseifolius TaxID=425828 RepID=A0AAW2C8Z9_9ROSI
MKVERAQGPGTTHLYPANTGVVDHGSEKTKKTTQSLRPSSDRSKERKTNLQAMGAYTGGRKRKSEGREYETPSPLPCTLKKLDVLLDKWIVDGINLPKKSRETRVSAICITTCNTLPQSVGRSVDLYIEESKKDLSNYLSQKSKETRSRTTRGRE